jgi:hypothetical protein
VLRGFEPLKRLKKEGELRCVCIETNIVSLRRKGQEAPAEIDPRD